MEYPDELCAAMLALLLAAVLLIAGWFYVSANAEKAAGPSDSAIAAVAFLKLPMAGFRTSGFPAGRVLW
jgi:hypothetical protein